MSLGHGTNISRNSLVFQYDMGNPKSWKGEPTVNLAKKSDETVDWSVSNLTANVTRTEIVPDEVYRITCNNNGGAFRFYFNLANLIDGQTYTMSFKYKIISGESEFRLTDWNDTTITRTTSQVREGVYYETGTGTRATYTSTYRFMDGIIGDSTVVEIWDVQLEQRSYATPYTKYQRANTQAILDISGQSNSITATSLTYNSDNTFEFNGSANYGSATSFNMGTDPVCSISLWVKRTASFASAGYWGLGGGSSNNGINGYCNPARANKIGWDLWGQTTFDTGIDYPLNEWVNVVWVKTSTGFTTSTLKIYINGVDTPLSYTARNNSSSVSLVQGITFGRLTASIASYYAPGVIANLSVYNRALTADEIKQNFEATRSIYGV